MGKSPSPLDAQEMRYDYPYHYLPEIDEKGFRQHRNWSWGYRYLGRLKVAFGLLDELEFGSLLDAGCGDGRFLREARARYGNRTLKGVDVSQKAVTFARMLNPGIDFDCCDLRQMPSEDKWDVVTALDVLEHIPTESLTDFIKAMAGLLRPGGAVVITAPHSNIRVTREHYQHFDATKLSDMFAADFEDGRYLYFDHIGLKTKLLLKLMGGAGKYFVITHRGLNNFLFRYYSSHCIYRGGEKRCERMAFTARRKRD